MGHGLLIAWIATTVELKKKRKKKTSTYVHVTDLGVTESLAAMLALQRNFKQAS